MIEGLVPFILWIERRKMPVEDLERNVALVYFIAVIGEIEQPVLAQEKRGEQYDDQQGPRCIPLHSITRVGAHPSTPLRMMRPFTELQ